MRYIFSNFSKKKRTKNEEAEAQAHTRPSLNSNLPEIYRGMQIYETDSDRFCQFDEDYFEGENYRQTAGKKSRKKRAPIAPPKTPPIFFFGIFCGALSVLIASGGIAFFSLFSKFGGIYTSVTVPSLVSLSEKEAIELIKNQYTYFDYSIEYKENPSVEDGMVISQIPKPSSARRLYGINGRITLKLTVNKAPKPLTLPSIIGQNAREVALELKNAGINVELSEVYSDEIKIGKIISSSHTAGSLINKNDTVYITASLGKQINYVIAPDLIGMSESAAISRLKKQGLDVNKVIYKSSPLPLGTVIAQSTEGGSSVREGSKITISVSG